MGLSIHYSGRLNNIAQLPELVEELKEFCTIFNWDFQQLDIKNITGIGFTPPECETLFFTFDEKGELISIVHRIYDLLPENTVSVKTQYAGMAIHKVLIELIRFLSKKYFSVFELFDEGGYWETGDESVLAQQFEVYETITGLVKNALETFPSSPGETQDDMIARLETFLKDKLDIDIIQVRNEGRSDPLSP